MNARPFAVATGRAVLFDLDGTLTDPFPGITRSFQYALECMGLETIPEADDLRWCIGPPLGESFAVLLGGDDPDRVREAVGHYRNRYGEVGLFENQVIDGIPEVLAALRDLGHTLYVATSKLREPAVRIVEHFGLAEYFKGIYGAADDGSLSTKGDLIAHLLEREGVDAKAGIMIGDRKHDLAGARVNNVAAIGVTYGYGSRAELQAESPLAIADTPREAGALVVEWSESVVPG
ncbi:phosphoglycolate phosphatase [Breoghania corrubedonensis]|uniref:Phosphoglycolate phosphatase n=1 Tax=Breoghania corrubedonensis TaxID=665038 RepID=A0A2T5VCQ1_9HYPH|nr:HAD family hydrolase [Breoghania corrubedonensis]PTW61515.1 phosphoglycolate phosphatase [Breoghania corrubedonensis]